MNWTAPAVSAILWALCASPGGPPETVADGDTATTTTVTSQPSSSNRCILDWGLPACALHPGECLQFRERVCLLPESWGKLSTRYRELQAEVGSWPQHCTNLRDADKVLCDKRIEAADVECTERNEAVLEAMQRAARSPLWPKLTTLGLAVLGATGAIWCALDEQPGDWPCWVGAGAGISAGMVAVFAW